MGTNAPTQASKRAKPQRAGQMLKRAFMRAQRMRTKPKIAIIDYGAGNIASVANALEKCGAKTIIAKTPAAMETSGIQTRKAATQNSDVQAQKGAKTSSAAKFAACLQKADAIVLPGVGSFSCAKNIS